MLLRYIHCYLLIAKDNLFRFFNFITPHFIGYSYTKREITDANDKTFTLYILDELYRFCGLTIYNESFGFETESDLWDYVCKHDCTIVRFPNDADLITNREKKLDYFQNNKEKFGC